MQHRTSQPIKQRPHINSKISLRISVTITLFLWHRAKYSVQPILQMDPPNPADLRSFT